MIVKVLLTLSSSIGRLIPVAVLGLMSSLALAENPRAHRAAHSGQAGQATVAADPYLLPSDPVTGEKLGNNAVVVQHEGRELRFANEGNAATFKADPTTYLAKVDKQMIEQQKPLYPLHTCIISGEKLGSMGDAADVMVGNRLVRLCCAGCQSELRQEPAKHLAKINEAVVKAQKASYPLTTCVVSGEALGSMGDGTDYVAGNRLVRFCCEGCTPKFQKDPAAALQKLDDAKTR